MSEGGESAPSINDLVSKLDAIERKFTNFQEETRRRIHPPKKETTAPKEETSNGHVSREDMRAFVTLGSLMGELPQAVRGKVQELIDQDRYSDALDRAQFALSVMQDIKPSVETAELPQPGPKAPKGVAAIAAQSKPADLPATLEEYMDLSVKDPERFKRIRPLVKVETLPRRRDL